MPVVTHGEARRRARWPLGCLGVLVVLPLALLAVPFVLPIDIRTARHAPIACGAPRSDPVYISRQAGTWLLPSGNDIWFSAHSGDPQRPYWHTHAPTLGQYTLIMACW